jgi:hypothetical protein
MMKEIHQALCARRDLTLDTISVKQVGMGGTRQFAPEAEIHENVLKEVKINPSAMRLAGLALLSCASGLALAGTPTTTTSPDPVFAYVSSSQGLDSNSGLSPNAPKRTLAAGYALLRNQSTDRMLLRRGDIWWNEQPHVTDASWFKSGVSAERPIVLGDYGNHPRRPVVMAPVDGPAIRFQTGAGLSFVRVEDIEFIAQRNSTNSPNGIVWWVAGGSLTVDNCKVQGFVNNINIDAPSPMSAQGFRVERCQVLDSFAGPSGHSQGIYVTNVRDVIIDQCVFDKNGYRLPDRAPTMFNHNIYLDQDATDIIVQDSIVARGSATGIQLRGQRMDAYRNLVLGNPLGITVGHDQQTASQVSRGIVFGNSVIDAADIGSGPSRSFRGFGIAFGRCNNLLVQDNIVAHGTSQQGLEPAYTIGAYSSNVRMVGNVGIDWAGPIIALRTQLSDSIQIGNNVFVNKVGRRVAVTEIPGGAPSDVGGTWLGNHYFGGGPTMFVVNYIFSNAQVWEDRTDDNVILSAAGTANADVSMPTFLMSVMPELPTPSDSTGAIDVFMEELRTLPLSDIDVRLRASTYTTWSRNRLGLAPLGQVPPLP